MRSYSPLSPGCVTVRTAFIITQVELRDGGGCNKRHPLKSVVPLTSEEAAMALGEDAREVAGDVGML